MCQRTLHPPSFVEIHPAAFVLTLCQANNPSDKRANSKKKKKKSTLCSACILQISRPDHLHRSTTTLRELIMFHMCFFVDVSLPDLTVILWANQDITRWEAQAGHFQVGAALPQGAEQAYTSKILSSSTGFPMLSDTETFERRLRAAVLTLSPAASVSISFPPRKVTYSGRKCCQRCCQLGATYFWNCAMHDCDWDQTESICGHWDRGRSRSYSRWGS